MDSERSVATRLRKELDVRLAIAAGLPSEPMFLGDVIRPSLAAFVAARSVAEAFIATQAPIASLGILATDDAGFVFSVDGDTEKHSPCKELCVWVRSDGTIAYVRQDGWRVLEEESVPISVDQLSELVSWLFENRGGRI